MANAENDESDDVDEDEAEEDEFVLLDCSILSNEKMSVEELTLLTDMTDPDATRRRTERSLRASSV